MAFLFDLTKPYLAYYSVPAAYVVTIAPRFYAGRTAGENFDIAYPRKVAEACAKDTSMDKKTALRIQRAEAAMANGFESIGMYAGGIAAAAAAGVPAETLSYLSALFLTSRVVYNIVYIFLQDNRKAAPLRTIVYNVGVGAIITLWVKAGNRAAA